MSSPRSWILDVEFRVFSYRVLALVYQVLDFISRIRIPFFELSELRVELDLSLTYSLWHEWFPWELALLLCFLSLASPVHSLSFLPDSLFSTCLDMLLSQAENGGGGRGWSRSEGFPQAMSTPGRPLGPGSSFKRIDTKGSVLLLLVVLHIFRGITSRLDLVLM